MGTHERMAIAAVMAGLRKSGAIDDDAVQAVADELAKVAVELANYGSREHAQFVALADDVAVGRVTRNIAD